MKLPRFSVLTMLLLATILALAFFSVVQNTELTRTRQQNQKLMRELGVIDQAGSDSISIRQLVEGGDLNTWRFRVFKPSSEYEYCFGIVNIDSSNTPQLPSEYRPDYQVVESNSRGDSTIALSLWRNRNSKWTVKFQEFEAQEEKVATATRMDGFSDEAMATAIPIKDSLIQSDLNPQSHFNAKHGEVFEYQKAETVWLVHAEKPGQPKEIRQAFVLAMRPKQKNTSEAE